MLKAPAHANHKEKAALRMIRQIVTAEQADDRRSEDRVDISIPVAVVPLAEGEPLVSRSFATLTKNISGQGLSLVVNKSLDYDQLLIGFPGPSSVSFVRTSVLHREPLALGCYKLGLRMGELVDADEFPALAKFSLDS